ncbi:MAG: oxidoreductase FAD/NAD(P)-binding domain-containing protein [Parcubacteria group bacterium Gr01-1014_48]|nr:MAG: oxidoreductase FAD/NAD(P)-binding domain-containing protein [Parcubacteria group bacterium Greene0416_14]TSC74349.1 MAG: oxidoreductase FAD/NAD(P)-binding domain-containing protein [Parcubacteria group bacterium Gr01-1014_48]TSD00734.1 MAG: oxidoreductase FAD/NAD(P)-binding domain-containing protein [Parcubacteria group bacterium Greene1014_15]TSD07856.1 MAG: oxidoreductase FAD/NAD(P)-binding domain-containing protein [Parcubacteria group bacterium Greene0714_4]
MPQEIYTVKLKRKNTVALDTVEFYFERPENFIYEPGQHIEIILINPPTMDESGNKRDFSLVSAPHEEDLVVVARIRDSAFKKGLNALSPGDTVSMRGPLGSSFRLHVDTIRPAVFIAGGIGIAPFMSMVRHILYNKLSYQMLLFHSNRRPEDCVYCKELSQLAAGNQQFTYIPTMTNMKQSTESWHGEEGRISRDLIEKHLDDAQTAFFYIAGPTSMVVGMDLLLHDMGVSRDVVRTEEFTGY